MAAVARSSGVPRALLTVLAASSPASIPGAAGGLLRCRTSPRSTCSISRLRASRAPRSLAKPRFVVWVPSLRRYRNPRGRHWLTGMSKRLRCGRDARCRFGDDAGVSNRTKSSEGDRYPRSRLAPGCRVGGTSMANVESVCDAQRRRVGCESRAAPARSAGTVDLWFGPVAGRQRDRVWVFGDDHRELWRGGAGSRCPAVWRSDRLWVGRSRGVWRP